MAAAAGAPGSGEGGEAEPDSEPISGDDRPRRDETEASAQHGGALDEAGHEETGLRMPDCIGPEVTHWDVEGPCRSLGGWQAEAERVEPPVVDTIVADVLSSPMQMETDLPYPPGPAPEASEESGVTPSQSESPPNLLNPDPSPQQQVTSETEPFCTPRASEEVDILPETSTHPQCPLLEETHVLDPVPDVFLQDQDSVDLPDEKCDPELVLENIPCTVGEPMAEEIPVPEVTEEEIPVPEVTEEEIPVPEVTEEEIPVPEVTEEEIPVPEVMAVENPVPEVTVEEMVQDTPKVTVEDVPEPEEIPVSEVMAEEMSICDPPVEEIPESEVMVKEIAKSEVTAEEIPVSEISEEEIQKCEVTADKIPNPEAVREENSESEVTGEEVPHSEVMLKDAPEFKVTSVPEPGMEDSNSVEADLTCVPETFHEEEKQTANHKEDYPEPTTCKDVLNYVEKECLSEKSPEETSLQLIMSDSAHVLEEAVSPMDSGISSELTSVEKELDSQSGPMETEPNVDGSLESYCQDVEYDPFYRDTKTEESDGQDATPTDIIQTDPCPEEPSAEADANVDDPNPCLDPVSEAQRLVTGGIDDLIPGSEVQVTLDHIIQDALVVSFRHGDRIFSGVLMDLSKRFGPHGIPVTVHPKREYKNKPEEPIAQPQSTSFQEEESLKKEPAAAPVDDNPVQPTEPCGVNNNLWTSKPPPLFHEGAPYPPPLFIRDTYNQSIPQPPPRKIKRLKKKIYREEPTSIMNAIKLRPRQVLCDKCKNVVSDKREVRKTTSDSFKLEEGKRRRHESVSTVNKKLKTDHKVNGKTQSESQKKNPVPKVSNLGQGRGKVVKVASQTHASKSQLHTKKVLQSKNMDHAKAREVLKLAKEKAQKKQKDTSSSKSAHSKVHFTRRLQNTTSGTLPPRLRIKPQRYRNEENDSSLKIGLESLRSSKMGIKPQTRYTATRSAGEAPSEIKTPSNGPEEVSSAIENPSACVPPGEQDEQQALSKRGSKSNITVYVTLNQKKADSSSASVCSSDSTDDLKSTHSECSSTENFDFPPGSMHAPSSSSSSSSKEEKKLSNSLKIKVFSKNVSKCVTPDGRTICVGDIVWAKIYGFPWWPARILTITISRKDNGLLVRQEASISWFGSPTTSFLALSQLSPFLENFQSRFNKKRKGLYRKAITEAAKAAKQMTPEVRALLTQFET